MRAECRERRGKRVAHGRRTAGAKGSVSPLWLGVLALFGCLFLSQSASFAATAATATDPVKALGLQAPEEVVEAPGFSLPDLTGKKIQLKELRGKLVLLNFFATWCGPCRDEMPGMERLFRVHRDNGLVVVAVNVQESARAVRPFVQQLKLSFPTVLDVEASVSREYGVRALPVTFLIGRDGNILWRAMGGRDWESAPAQKYFAQRVGATK